MLLRFGLKCQSPDCRSDLPARVHFAGLGSSAIVMCPKCKLESEFTSVVGGIEAHVVEKKDKEKPATQAPNLTSQRP